MNIFVLLLLGAVIPWLLRRSKHGSAWAKPAVVVCSVLVVLLAAYRIFDKPTLTVGAAMARYEQYRAICGEVLGESLVARHPGARVVLLTTPGMTAPGSRTFLDRLQATLESGGLTVTREPVTPPGDALANMIPSDDPNIPPEMAERARRELLEESSLWFDTAFLKDLLSGLRGRADVVVCSIHFRMGSDGAKQLPANGPALVLVNVDVPEPQQLIADTVLDTVVVFRNNPDMWKPDVRMPRQRDAAFRSCYEMIVANE
jgi:hypothetical protein